jgi:aquaporin Z
MTAPLHWREYLMEVAGLGLFMVSAATMASVLEHPASPVRALIADATVRRELMGIAMGLTAAALIYSPWGRRSGAHINPAVTLTFWRLGKISGPDALAYMAAQFTGGAAGIGVAAILLRPWIAHPSVNYIATVPGEYGAVAAFVAEALISFVLMLVVLTASSHARLARFTGVLAALLIACFITIEAPLSGMSMNPARTLGPDVVANMFPGVWIYFAAPTIGMLGAAEVVMRLRDRRAIRCAKLYHDSGHCIFGCTAQPRAYTSDAVFTPTMRPARRLG